MEGIDERITWACFLASQNTVLRLKDPISRDCGQEWWSRTPNRCVHIHCTFINPHTHTHTTYIPHIHTIHVLHILSHTLIYTTHTYTLTHTAHTTHTHTKHIYILHTQLAHTLPIHIYHTPYLHIHISHKHIYILHTQHTTHTYALPLHLENVHFSVRVNRKKKKSLWSPVDQDHYRWAPEHHPWIISHWSMPSPQMCVLQNVTVACTLISVPWLPSGKWSIDVSLIMHQRNMHNKCWDSSERKRPHSSNHKAAPGASWGVPRAALLVSSEQPAIFWAIKRGKFTLFNV